ncbi:MAG TPA: cobyrinate a,c-diamide synthase [Chloroflexota bacterium]
MTARILLAGTHSSVGKTTVALALLAAWQRQGLRPAPFKVGPDYIDPSLHAQAAGRPSRNLDSWLLDERTLRGVVRRGTRSADVAVIEGVMGLFDGIGATQTGSTASIARALACPVVLVLDVAAMSGTAAALVLGCQLTRPGVDMAGVILNRVGIDGHVRSVEEAIRAATGLPVLGSLPSDATLSIPERHLGLVPAGEGGVTEETLDRLADLAERRFELGTLRRIAEAAAPLADDSENELIAPVAPVVRIGVAQDAAFGFYYQDTIDLLAECGAEVVTFSPLQDASPPRASQGVYLGGGFPELFAEELSNNEPMRASMHDFAKRGCPVYAECGGLMVLGQTLTTFDGEAWPMFDVLPLASRMQRQSLTIGYREVEALRSSPLMKMGTRVRGHEFHWSVAEPPTPEHAAYRVLGENRLEGFAMGAILGSYVHLNLAGAPDLARRFVEACAAAPA